MNTLPMPSWYTQINAQARLAPHHVAVVTPQEKFTYRRFCSDIDKASRQFHALALPRESRVGILVAGMYLHWVVSIALSRMGLLSATCMTNTVATLGPDVVVSDLDMAHPGARMVRVSRDWINTAVGDLPPFNEPLHAAEAPARIVMSSGTTGEPKLASFSNGAMYERTRVVIADYRMTPSTRQLCLMGASSIGGMVWPLACWMAGGTMLLTAPRQDKGIYQLLREQPNQLYASTAQLDGLVESLPADFQPMHDMVAYVAGSVLPRALNRKARMRLTPQLMMVYGSTEIGTATLAPASHVDIRPGLTGYVHPPVQLEVIDEDGKPVPEGTIGEVRMRTLGQCQVYLDDPETSAQTFRNGWFYPGDLGVLGPQGDLYIKGRVRELMNFGGVKVSPNALDDLLAGVAGVTDLAAFAIEAGTQTRPCIAVVATGAFNEEEMRASCRKAMPTLPPLTIVRVEAIPRNEMGKVLRLDLAKQVQASIT